MSDQFQTERFDARAPAISRPFPPLPAWLARRLLRPGEEITWVVGPRFNPSWERYITHPSLFVIALGLAAAGWGAGRRIADNDAQVPLLMGLIGGGFVLASIFVLGISSGYFTRLVVTDRRLFILQGYELCRTWNIDDLPRSLLRYVRPGSEKTDRIVDLDAVKTMLGGSSDKFAEAKTILTFGKRLDQITARENDRP